MFYVNHSAAQTELIFDGGSFTVDSGQIVAGNPKIFGQLLQVIAPHLTPALIAAQRK